MDISGSLDSFSKTRPLKYTFEQHSIYARPVRLDRSRLKWHRVSRLLARPETAILLHPVMRSLGQIYVRKKRLKLKLSVARKLTRRSRRSRNLPSFRPFMCQRCSLSSFSLNVIKKHECRRRKYKAYSLDELEKAASLGTRSGVRNAMSVMEMAEYPNRVRLPPPAKSLQPSKLEQSLPIRKNQRVPEEFCTSRTTEVVQKVKESHSFCGSSTESSHLASFCMSCRRSFNKSADFKKHAECANPNELKFLAKNFHQFPSAGVQLLSDNAVDSLISMLCCNCSRADFRDTVAFHEHIMNCI